MTSSLVVSEMCIRDSTRRLGATTQEGKASSLSKQINKKRNVFHTRSVSYTHLTLPTICSV
eukprot:10633940-Prorocentrum_lima.AAC.1